ncbi:hypothetical protein [Streptomyces sp. NPDC002537]
MDRTYCTHCAAALVPAVIKADGPAWRRHVAEWLQARPRVWQWDRRRIVVMWSVIALVVCTAVGLPSYVLRGTACAASRIEDRLTGQVREVPTEVTAAGDRWRATFDNPYRLTNTVLFIAMPEEPGRLKSAQPMTVSITAVTKSGTAVTKDVELADPSGEEGTYWGLDRVVEVIVRVVSHHAGSGAGLLSPGLAEVQFFTRD